jgi:leucyl aminopeptidase
MLDIKVVLGELAKIEADAIVLSYFEGDKKPDRDIASVDSATGGAIRRLIDKGETKGKLNEITLLHSLGNLPSTWIAVLGLGKREDLSTDRIRGAFAEACRFLRKKGCTVIATRASSVAACHIDVKEAARALAEGSLLGLYSFRRHITSEAEYSEVRTIIMVTGNDSERMAIEQGSIKGRIMAEAASRARDMANEPANYMTPSIMAAEAQALAEGTGLDVTVLEEDKIAELGMGGLLGVARGSREKPRLIVLNYRGSDEDGIDIALVGKGITFDSGGISIKPSDKMSEMKGDMAGGAAVIAAMQGIARLKPAINVMGVVPATENLPDGNAIKPGDVLTAMGGKTIEIISTDAEGRLVLADALGYVGKANAKRIVDVATLTGACHIALGDVCSGAFGNNQGLVDRVVAAGKDAGELIWPMPMYEQYKEQNKSDIADIKNSGGRYGGAITAAQFLAEFVGKTPWVHLDIAGTFLSDKEKGYLTKGATGVPVRTIINLVLDLAD